MSLYVEKVWRTNERTDGRTDGRTDKQTDLCIELRYAQLIRKPGEETYALNQWHSFHSPCGRCTSHARWAASLAYSIAAAAAAVWWQVRERLQSLSWVFQSVECPELHQRGRHCFARCSIYHEGYLVQILRHSVQFEMPCQVIFSKHSQHRSRLVW